jgi:membrane associated rhomboid family serine protease
VLPIHDNIPTRRLPAVTIALIVVNVGVWLFYELPNLNRAILDLGFFPCEVDGACRAPVGPWQVDAVMSMFLHGSWIHLIGNMLFLWIFGNNVEDAMGRIRFLAFYLASGFAATALQTWVTLRFGTPQDAVIPTVGASGAIAGVLGAYFILYPRAYVLTLVFFFIPVAIPAVFFLGIWFVFQLWQGGFDVLAPSGSGEGGIAFFAHVGGFVFGVIAVRFFTAGRHPPRRAPAWPRAEL